MKKEPIKIESYPTKKEIDEVPTRKKFEARPCLSKKNSTESQAVYLFEKYIYEKYGDRFMMYEDKENRISDIRYVRKGYNSVFADYVIYDTVKEKDVFFEIKGTTKPDKYWGGVTFKELMSAVNAGKDYDYYFAIIYTKNGGKNPFIHPKRVDVSDPYGVFLTLQEFLQYTTRASLGIQFEMEYNKNLEIISDKKKDPFATEDDVKEFLKNEFIQKKYIK